MLSYLCGCGSGTSGGRNSEWAAGPSDFSPLEDFADGTGVTSGDDTGAWGKSGYHLSDSPDQCVLCTSYFLQTREGVGNVLLVGALQAPQWSGDMQVHPSLNRDVGPWQFYGGVSLEEHCKAMH